MVKKVIRGHALSTTTQHKKLKSGNSVQGYKEHVGRGNARNFQALARQNKHEPGNDFVKTDTVSSDGEEDSPNKMWLANFFLCSHTENVENVPIPT